MAIDSASLIFILFIVVIILLFTLMILMYRYRIYDYCWPFRTICWKRFARKIKLNKADKLHYPEWVENLNNKISKYLPSVLLSSDDSDELDDFENKHEFTLRSRDPIKIQASSEDYQPKSAENLPKFDKLRMLMIKKYPRNMYRTLDCSDLSSSSRINLVSSTPNPGAMKYAVYRLNK